MPLAGPWRGHRRSGNERGSGVWKSRPVSILLQVGHWCLRRARRRFEQRMACGWDRTLSTQLDRILTAEQLTSDALASERIGVVTDSAPIECVGLHSKPKAA